MCPTIKDLHALVNYTCMCIIRILDQECENTLEPSCCVCDELVNASLGCIHVFELKQQPTVLVTMIIPFLHVLKSDHR